MNNQSAFPTPGPSSDFEWMQEHGHAGMTLRDFFAGQVLPAIVIRSTHVDAEVLAADRAKAAYRYADAMLVAREAKGGA